jgi:hypothetical protein
MKDSLQRTPRLNVHANQVSCAKLVFRNSSAKTLASSPHFSPAILNEIIFFYQGLIKQSKHRFAHARRDIPPCRHRISEHRLSGPEGCHGARVVPMRHVQPTTRAGRGTTSMTQGNAEWQSRIPRTNRDDFRKPGKPPQADIRTRFRDSGYTNARSPGARASQDS